MGPAAAAARAVVPTHDHATNIGAVLHAVSVRQVLGTRLRMLRLLKLTLCGTRLWPCQQKHSAAAGMQQMTDGPDPACTSIQGPMNELSKHFSGPSWLATYHLPRFCLFCCCFNGRHHRQPCLVNKTNRNITGHDASVPTAFVACGATAKLLSLTD